MLRNGWQIYVRLYRRKINSIHFEIAFGKAFWLNDLHGKCLFFQAFFPLLYFAIAFISFAVGAAAVRREYYFALGRIVSLSSHSSYFALQSFYYVWQI